MTPFWDRVNKMVFKYEDQYKKGYLEIKSHDIIYRSLPPDDHGIIIWVSWEPFKVMGHFSYLTDPEGTIKWVKMETQTKPCGD